MSKITRKYQTEFNLNIYSSEPVIISPSDLDKVPEIKGEVKRRLNNSNIYFILKRPRIAFIPKSLIIVNREVQGMIGIQTEDGLEEYSFTIKGILPDQVKSIKESKYPHTKLSFIDDKGNLISTHLMMVLLNQMNVNLKGKDFCEVVYVGQAFGVSGERTAIERLSSHSTLQKILANVSANEPHMEVFLALYQFEFHRFIMNMGGQVDPKNSRNLEEEHLKNALNSNFKRSMRISLAEAAFIRYFEPEYNKIYKKEFPAKRHKILKKLYDYDFAAMTVEASVEDLGLQIYSPSKTQSSHHMASFDLHDKNERDSFFYTPLTNIN